MGKGNRSIWYRGIEEGKFISSISIFPYILISVFLFSSNAKAQYQFLSPIPNSEHHPIETNIIFRNGDFINEQSLQSNLNYQISGSKSGNQLAKIFLSEDGKTVIIDPNSNFEINEEVNITIKNIEKLNGEKIDSINFSFFTTKISSNKKSTFSEDYFLDTLLNKNYTSERFYDSVPSTFPEIITDVYNNPFEGYIFFQNTSNLASNNDRFISVINHQNIPFFYIQDNSRGLSFTKQKNNQYSYFNPFNNNFLVLDSLFNTVDSFACGNGYIANYHDFQLLPNGHSYLLAYDVQQIDMSKLFVGGDSIAEVSGTIIQELDKDKNVIFQWRSWDYMNIIDALHYVDFTEHYISYIHTNSIDIDEEGNILFSNYIMDEITKIDGNTGQFIWRLGGNNNQFTFINDSIKFNTQHDARKLPNGNITLYDNGVFHIPAVSSAKEYEIDEENKTVKLVWSFTHPEKFLCSRMGNVQRLPNENTLINWGRRGIERPSVTEVKPDGTIVHEITFKNSGHQLYRAYKFSVNDTINTVENPFNNISEIYNYPNPANEKTNIYFTVNSKQELNLKIYDVAGNLVMKKEKITTFIGKNHIELNLNSFKNGIYFYSLSNNFQSKKLIIVR